MLPKLVIEALEGLFYHPKYHSMTQRIAAFLVALVIGPLAFAQITVDNSLTPQEYVEQVLVGGGVTVTNVTYNGQSNAMGGQFAIGSFQSVNTILPLDSGLVLSSGSVLGIPSGSTTFDPGSGLSGDQDLLELSGQSSINDYSILEFDFIPTGDTVSFNYIFASYEYTSFTCSQYNDAFGFFISGPGISGPFSNNAMNIAVVPNTNIPITINTINDGLNADAGNYCYNADPNWQANSIYYVDNDNEVDMNFNGLTVTLTAWAEVICGETYHIKLAIGDAVDSGLDSGVFLEGGSFSSTGQVVPTLAGGVGINGNTMMEGCGPFELIFTRLGDLTEEATVQLGISGTSTAGTDYSPAFPAELYFAPNVENISVPFNVPVDADGAETLVIDIYQLIACANQNLVTTFTFNIDSPLPLTVDSYDLNSVCGQVNLLDPQVTGGVGEYVYDWSTGDTTATIEVEPGVTTTYSLTVSDGCQVLDEMVDYTITLPVYPPLQATMGPDTQIDCLGSEDIYVESVSGGNNVFEFVWTLNGDEVGTGQTINVPSSAPVYYVVTITEGCGTSIQDSLMVSTVPLDPIVITTTEDPTVICPGDSTLMEVLLTVGGNGVYTYEWFDQYGQSMSNSAELQVSVIADHTYTIVAEDQCQNTGNTTVTTFLPVYEPFVLQLPSDRVLCAGDSVQIYAQVQGGSGYYTLDWHDMEHSDPMLMVQPWNDTEYIVTAYDQCGAQRTDEVLIEVEHVSVDIVETNRGEDDWYLQAATTPYANTWVWQMGDVHNTTYRGPEVVHSYMDLEEHWVRLKISTPNGCKGTDSLLIRPPGHLYFPNAFTPDGDGYNDMFGPIGHYITSFEMEIFDRWGHPVFFTNTVDDLWDGSVLGSGLASTGVYVYKYKVEGHYFPSKEGYGHVTLLQGSQDQ